MKPVLHHKKLTPVLPENTEPTVADPVDVLARTLWGEARSESVRGIEAVACVILNRVAKSKNQNIIWWGRDVVSVCRKPFQFSCWNANDPNYDKIQTVTENDPVFQVCQRIARRGLSGTIADPTLGATHYHAESVRPSWAEGKAPCARIGRHLFYNDIA